MEHLGVLKNSLKRVRAFQIELLRTGKTRILG